MSQFKRLLHKILEMETQGLTEAEIARDLQIGRSVVEYVIATYKV